jgi:hypothetical protein
VKISATILLSLEKSDTDYVSQTWGMTIEPAFITKLTTRVWHLLQPYQHTFDQLSGWDWYISRYKWVPSTICASLLSNDIS